MADSLEYERQASRPDKAAIWLKRIFLGGNMESGWIGRIIVYVILASVAIVYLNPLLYMFSSSFQTLSDLLDPEVRWIPTELEWENYTVALSGLSYETAIRDTFLLSVSVAGIQLFMCAMTGYAFARLHIPGKRIWFALVILTFLIPKEITTIPLLMWFGRLGWFDSIWPFVIPAFFAHGLKAPLFIFIFRQFFAKLPRELEESARVDGAGAYRTYFTIVFPLAKPAMLVVFILSFVWHWNDSFYAALYLQGDEFQALAIQMELLQSRLNYLSGDITGTGYVSKVDLNEPIKMAASTLIILPPLLLYMFLQKYFIRGIDRSGIVE